MAIVREIALKKDESLLVTVVPDVCKYARLVGAVENLAVWTFDLNVPHVIDGTEYAQVEVVFDSVPYYASYYQIFAITADGHRREIRQVGRSFWERRTVKGLLVWELGVTGEGYEIVDWGGYAVPDDRPA